MGINKFKADDDMAIDLLRVDNGNVRRLQIDKLKRLRSERDEAAVTARLEALTKAADTNENLLALAVDAGPGQGHGRRDFRGPREGLGPAPRRDPLDLRRLQA